MQTIASISKSTQKGVSVFHFVKTPTGEYWAFGGIQAKAMQFKSLAELNKAITTWTKSYGYSFGVDPKPAKKQVTNKQKSELPADIQADLWALEPTAA